MADKERRDKDKDRTKDKDKDRVKDKDKSKDKDKDRTKDKDKDRYSKDSRKSKESRQSDYLESTPAKEGFEPATGKYDSHISSTETTSSTSGGGRTSTSSSQRSGMLDPKVAYSSEFESLLKTIEDAAKANADDLETVNKFSSKIATNGPSGVEAALEVFAKHLNTLSPESVFVVLGLMEFCVSQHGKLLFPALVTSTWQKLFTTTGQRFKGGIVTKRVVTLMQNWDHAVAFTGICAYPSPFYVVAHTLSQQYPACAVNLTSGNQVVQYKGKCGACGTKLLFPPNSVRAVCGRCSTVVQLPKNFNAALSTAISAQKRGFGTPDIVALKEQNDVLKSQVHKQDDLQKEIERLRLENERLRTQSSSANSDAILCSICLDNEKNAALDPCGHSFCNECAAELVERKRDCPVCRTKIKRINKVYLTV